MNILSRSKIRQLCHPVDPGIRPLLSPYDSTRSGDYHYDLSIGKIIVPDARPTAKALSSGSGCYVEPNSMIWVRSAERISLPDSVLAQMHQTNHFTKEGLSVLNLTLVFPRYDGYLTCVVANLTNQPVEIRSGDTITRLLFFSEHKEFYDAPRTGYSRSINEEEYDRDLIQEVSGRTPDFFGMLQLEGRILKQVEDVTAKRFVSATRWALIFGGILIFAATFLPLTQGWVRSAYFDANGMRTMNQNEIRSAVCDEMKRQLRNLPPSTTGELSC